MKVKRIKVLQEAVFSSVFEKIDYQDTFCTTNTSESLETITMKIFGTAPRWITALMKVRNGIVRLFGIRVEKRPTISEKFEKGGHIYFFQIYEVHENEALLGADDKHLDFRVSVVKKDMRENNVSVTTYVRYKNRFGKVYMWIVKPFHRMVVK